MIMEDTNDHNHHGIEAVYFLGDDIPFDCLQKLQQTAELTLDDSDPRVQKICADNMILIGFPTELQILKYLQWLRKNPTIEGSLRSKALNWHDVLPAIKEKKFALITHRNLSVDTHGAT